MNIKQTQIQNLIIYIGDVIGISLGYLIMTHVRFEGYIFKLLNNDNRFFYRWLISIFVLTIVYFILNPNLHFFKRKLKEEIRNDLQTNILTATLMATIAYLINDARDYSRFVYLTTMVFSCCWMILSHTVYRWYILKYRQYNSVTRKMLIITTSDRVEKVVKNIIREKTWNLWVTGIVVIDKDLTGKKVMNIPIVANRNNMFRYAIREVVDEVFILVPEETENYQIQQLIQKFEEMGITVDININLYEIDVSSGTKYLNQVGNYPTVTFASKEIPLYMIAMKRLLDIIGAIVGLIITAVATIVIGPLIKLESPGPLFFSQKRVGRNGRIFKIYKFRSMYADAERRKKELMEQNEMNGLMFKMTDDPRITKIGKFIRKTSLDELPQFWNVLKGDMSLVGTRPPTVDEFQQYEWYHKRRLSMTPGLTGVWQVSGRSDITDFEEIVSMDVEYIKNWSLKRDIEIILKTVQVVLHSDGAR